MSATALSLLGAGATFFAIGFQPLHAAGGMGAAEGGGISAILFGPAEGSGGGVGGGILGRSTNANGNLGGGGRTVVTPAVGGSNGSLPAELAPVISTLGQRPVVGDTSAYIVDKLAAQQLGKALFWDSQAGSDGQACASCHFHAGADIRVPNQVNPGIPSNPDATFHVRASDASLPTGPNATLGASDFPFHQLADANNRNSAIVYDTNDRFASEGSFSGTFIPSPPPTATASSPLGFDNCVRAVDPTDPFNDKTSVMFRRVEPRNTPSVINAAYNFRQFWDGRANNVFNGVDPFGRRTNLANPAAGILIAQGAGQASVLVKIEIANASLASQATGPIGSPFEMSCNGRALSDIGRRLLTVQALATQVVHPQDSLLSQTAGLINAAGPGLTATYADLIRKAFYPQYWSDPTRTTITPTGAVVADPVTGYNQMEHNFSLFWGLAIQEYEALLVSNQTKFDRGTFFFTAQEKKGLNIFQNKGKCALCHSGPLFSAATQVIGNDAELVERMVMGDGTVALYDHGFYNIGVRPAYEDRGLGGVDGTALGLDLSFTRQYKWLLMGQTGKVADTFHVNQCSFEVQNNPATCFQTNKIPNIPASSPRDAVDGSFKVPILRNVGLTPPYFHNGGQATLHDVVDFYSRGGDRRGSQSADTTGYPLSGQQLDTLLAGADIPANLVQPPNSFGQTTTTNMAPNIPDSGGSNGRFSQDDKDALVAFLLTLTDNRVACHSGVFDHPELVLFLGNRDAPSPTNSPVAQDIKVKLPAVGARGLSTCFPNTGSLFGELQTFFMSIVTPVP